MGGEWKCQRQFDPAHLPPLLRDRSHKDQVTALTQPGILHTHPRRHIPHRPKGAEEGQGTPSPAGNLWPKEGLRCPLPTRESSGTVLLRQRSTPASLKGLPLGSLTAVTPTRKTGRRDPPVDSLSTPAEVEQPQPLRVAAWLGTVEPLLRPALGRLGHAQPSNGASDVGLQPRPWRPAPPPRPRDAPSA